MKAPRGDFRVSYLSVSPLALLGDPGSGKTHSVLDVAKERLANGLPALVIPAKAINPSQPSSEWLPAYLDKPTWSLKNCFQAMEITSFWSVQAMGNSGAVIPSKFLLVVDGLEESSRNRLWKQTLEEWDVILCSFPHIQACLRNPTIFC